MRDDVVELRDMRAAGSLCVICKLDLERIRGTEVSHIFVNKVVSAVLNKVDTTVELSNDREFITSNFRYVVGRFERVPTGVNPGCLNYGAGWEDLNGLVL